MSTLKKYLIVLVVFAAGVMVGCQKDTVLTPSDGAPRNQLPAAIAQPVTVAATGKITVAFSPNGGGQELIINQIKQAKTSIKLMAYAFTDKKIAGELAAAADRGVDVRLVIDDSQARQDDSLKAAEITKNKATIVYDPDFAIMHNKVMIIDDNRLFTGSYNYSNSANVRNAENLLLIEGNQPLVDLYLTLFSWRWDKLTKAG
ncbi:MAG: phospholipase D family protein [Negativicutes bacterium]|nr:phospholipase D family protein [Negativicutes bacterium]